MDKYTFNRNQYSSAEEFYETAKQKMDLPQWFGKNADALWDMLTGYIDTPCEITLVGFNNAENKPDRLEFGIIKKVFMRAQEFYPKKFKIIFED